jgi:hypothetical protein
MKARGVVYEKAMNGTGAGVRCTRQNDSDKKATPVLSRSFDRHQIGQPTHPKYGRSNGMASWAWVYSRLADSDAERSEYLSKRCKEWPEDDQ